MLNRKKGGKRNIGGWGREAEGGKDREIVTKKEYKETREKKMESKFSP